MTNPIPHDPVTRPAHYTAGAVECIDAIRAALGDDGFVAYCRGAAMKYAWRSGLKANHAEDLRKGAWYLTKAAEALEGKPTITERERQLLDRLAAMSGWAEDGE